MLNHFLTLIAFAVLATVCGFALLKGDTTERQGATILAVVTLASVLVTDFIQYMPAAVLAFDLTLVGVFGLLAWKSHRSWPVWATTFQLIAIIVDVCRGLDVKITPFAYASALNLSSYGVQVTLAVGTYIAWREREALQSFGINPQAEISSPAKARSISSNVRPTPKMATKDPKRGPWF